MKLNNAQTVAALIATVLLIGGGIFFFFKRAFPPEPTLGPGQSIKNPFGTVPSRGAGGGPTVTIPGQGGANTVIPKPGTVDSRGMMGPSKGAPIPGTR